MSRTTRIPDAHASSGAVNQHGRSLPVYRCNTCGDEVVWAESKRTGRRYLVNVRRGYHDQRYYRGDDLHGDCREQVEQRRAEAEKQARTFDLLALNRAVKAAQRAGDDAEVSRLLDLMDQYS